MATKMEGYGLEDGAWAQMKPRNSRASWRCATMVLHDDDHERVFTESEVRAMLKDYNDAIYDPGRFARRRLGEPLPQWTEAAQAAALAKHGVSLDPA